MEIKIKNKNLFAKKIKKKHSWVATHFVCFMFDANNPAISVIFPI